MIGEYKVRVSLGEVCTDIFHMNASSTSKLVCQRVCGEWLQPLPQAFRLSFNLQQKASRVNTL